MKRRRRGFTLIEIMVVVVLIAILATVVLTNVMSQAAGAEVKLTAVIISKIDQKIDLFKLNHGRYPEQLEDLLTRPAYVEERKWPPGGYLKKKDELNDAWNKKLIYRRGSSGAVPYELGSLGADGKEGGEGEDKDVWNRDVEGR